MNSMTVGLRVAQPNLLFTHGEKILQRNIDPREALVAFLSFLALSHVRPMRYESPNACGHLHLESQFFP